MIVMVDCTRGPSQILVDVVDPIDELDAQMAAYVYVYGELPDDQDDAQATVDATTRIPTIALRSPTRRRNSRLSASNSE